jgi:hypothetical protein
MRRRTEQLGIEFVDGLAKGWTFGLVDAFKINLDIRLDQRIDSVASRTKEQKLGRKLNTNEKVLRNVWTRGVPPAFSLSRGHIFHEPPEVHKLPWDEALKVLRTTVSIIGAQPDAGALIEVLPQDDDAEGASVIESEERSDRRGWVEIEILHYEAGEVRRKEKTVMFQSAFAEFLRTGVQPQAEVEAGPSPSLTLEQALQHAITSAELVHLVYNGGSTPGEERPLIPIRLSSEELIAKTPGLDILKPYKLAKIASVLLKDGRFAVNHDAVEVPASALPYAASLEEYTKALRPTLAAAGWNVFEGSNVLGVGRFTKDGKPRRRPIIAIRFMDRTQEEKLDLQTGELFIEQRELTGRERPWRVESELQVQAKAFGDLHKAIEFFTQEVSKSNAA